MFYKIEKGFYWFVCFHCEYLRAQKLEYIVLNWDTLTSSQVLKCDDVVLEIYLDQKFQLPQQGLNFESLAHEVVT